MTRGVLSRAPLRVLILLGALSVLLGCSRLSGGTPEPRFDVDALGTQAALGIAATETASARTASPVPTWTAAPASPRAPSPTRALPAPVSTPTFAPSPTPTTPPPTATATPTKPAPTAAPTVRPTPPPITLSGSGDQTSSQFTLRSGLAIFHVTHNGSSDFTVELDDGQGNSIDDLVDVTGAFDGAAAEGIDTDGPYLLNITADGDWTVTITQPSPTSAPSAPQTYTGHSQQVTPFFHLHPGTAAFQMTHNGQSDFVVTLLDTSGYDVQELANTTGAFNGSQSASISDDGLYFLEVAADGDWTVSVAQ